VDSAVVANNTMNRERQLRGVNSYTRELGFDPVAWLKSRPRIGSAPTRWLDLCCGSGRALIQAAHEFPQGDCQIVGVDLVPAFAAPAAAPGLSLITAELPGWASSSSFDLITCIHGLHYVGDKLGLLTQAATWLTETGQFIADLDLTSVRLPDGSPVGRRLTATLRTSGFAYDPRRHRIIRTGPPPTPLPLPYEFIGADDRAGPNYTGQPAVHSHYRPLTATG
jgi:SAM-dependent methyltransferase